MKDVLQLYPKFSICSAAIAALLLSLLALPLVSQAGATTISKAEVSSAPKAVKLGKNDCRADHWPYVPTCEIAGRKVRVIKF